MKFIAWRNDVEGDVLIGGDSPQWTSLIREGWRTLYEIDALTWEEACAVHHLRQGWEPYKPAGAPATCPSCKQAIYYPEGSGRCWLCQKEPEDGSGTSEENARSDSQGTDQREGP